MVWQADSRTGGWCLLPTGQDNDDVACWDLRRDPQQVVVIHDFADPGWEHRSEYPTFYAWLRQAIEDLIEFD